MMQINMMIPLCTISSDASHKKIAQEIKLLTGLDTVAIYELKETLHPTSHKSNIPYQLGVETKDMNINMEQISQTLLKIRDLERQNRMLRKDLADFYKLFQSQIQKMSASSKEKCSSIPDLTQKGYELSQQEQQREKKDPSLKEQQIGDVEGDKENERSRVQKQIQKLVQEKRSKEEIIQRLSVYCQWLLKIIESKKLPIF